MSKKYFNNEEIESAVQKFLATVEYDDKGNPVKFDTSILEPYTDQFLKLIVGVINTHKIYRFHNDMDELIHEGFAVLYESIYRFDPNKGTAFNYFSIVVKQHLKNWTQKKNRKEWVTSELTESIYHSEEFSDNGREIERHNLESLLGDIDIDNEEQEEILQTIIDSVFIDKISDKKDIMKVLYDKGFTKKDIDVVYEKISDKIEEELF